MTGPEINRFDGAVRFMELHCQRRRSGLWWVTTDKDTPRSVISDVQKRITKLQGKQNLPPYNATTFETRGGIHAHIIFIGNAEISEHLKSSEIFGASIEVARVPNPSGLTRKYLAKERTPQAGYARGHLLGGRIGGSHRLDGGGDRVRLSRDLERDAIEANYIEDWQHTNARRTDKRKNYQLRTTGPHARAPQQAGQLPLFPDTKPVSRLHDFGGGIVPPVVAIEIEFQRKRRGLSQRQLGNMIGVGQSQIANAMRGHDPMSRAATNRLREKLL